MARIIQLEGYHVLQASSIREGLKLIQKESVQVVITDVKLPDGKVLIPGVIDSTTNFIEHPELIADRICNLARIVGRENVIAGTDCGFGTFAGFGAVHPAICWAKMRTLAEGARLASMKLWGQAVAAT